MSLLRDSLAEKYAWRDVIRCSRILRFKIDPDVELFKSFIPRETLEVGSDVFEWL